MLIKRPSIDHLIVRHLHNLIVSNAGYDNTEKAILSVDYFMLLNYFYL